MEVALAKNKSSTVTNGMQCYQPAACLQTCFAHGTQRFEFSGDLNSHVTAESHGAREAVDKLSDRHRNPGRRRTKSRDSSDGDANSRSLPGLHSDTCRRCQSPSAVNRSLLSETQQHRQKLEHFIFTLLDKRPKF